MPALQSRQAQKIRELREAPVATGFLHLAEQSDVLALPRSTVPARHRTSGLSGSVIRQMLAEPNFAEAGPGEDLGIRA